MADPTPSPPTPPRTIVVHHWSLGRAIGVSAISAATFGALYLDRTGFAVALLVALFLAVLH